MRDSEPSVHPLKVCSGVKPDGSNVCIKHEYESELDVNFEGKTVL